MHYVYPARPVAPEDGTGVEFANYSTGALCSLPFAARLIYFADPSCSKDQQNNK
jgi:hypothetical protein